MIRYLSTTLTHSLIPSPPPPISHPPARSSLGGTHEVPSEGLDLPEYRTEDLLDPPTPLALRRLPPVPSLPTTYVDFAAERGKYDDGRNYWKYTLVSGCEGGGDGKDRMSGSTRW